MEIQFGERVVTVPLFFDFGGEVCFRGTVNWEGELKGESMRKVAFWGMVFFLLVVTVCASGVPLFAKGGKSRLGDRGGESVVPFDYGSDPVRYLENDRVCLGIDLSIGGAVTYLTDALNGGENMINSADWGRQIQLSYYSGPVPYVGPNGEEPAEMWKGLGWNPIQSGDCGGFRSTVVDFKRIGKNKMWVKTIPKLWPNKNVLAETTFEVLYTLTSDGFTMDATIKNHRSDRTLYPPRSQEMPALYTNGRWFRLIGY